MSLPRGESGILDLDEVREPGSSNAQLMMDLGSLHKLMRLHEEKSKQPPSATRKFCLEFKSRSADKFEQEDIDEIRQHYKRVQAERAQADSAKVAGKTSNNPQQEQVSEELKTEKLSEYRPISARDHTPDPRNLIATIALPDVGGNAKFGWMVMEGQWLYSATVCTYRVPTEWKVTQLVGMEDTKIAVLGRNGCGKTLVEIYHLMKPFEKLFEKVFTYGQKDVWQFGTDGGGSNLVLGCQNELGILDIEKRSYEAALISRRIKGWGARRVRSLCCDGKRILIANDRDLTIQIFTMAFTVSGTITIQEHIDCIWSMAIHGDKIFVCGGIAGEAFTVDWQGKMQFSFRPPEAHSVAIPAVVEADCDGFVHVFWLVKVEGSFRAVDFFYNIQEDKCFAEVRLDKKVKYMTSVKRPPLDPAVKTANGRTVVMTDEGDLYVSDSIFENSRGL